MAILSEDVKGQVKEYFDEKLNSDVRMLVFTVAESKLVVPNKKTCQYCKETVQLTEEMGSLSDHITTEVYEKSEDPSTFEQYGIGDELPAIVLLGSGGIDFGIRFYGIPSGYEFRTLMEDLVDVAGGESGLSDETKQALAKITSPVHLQVFVTPT